MKKFLLLMTLLLSLGPPVLAQQSQSGSITTNASDCTLVTTCTILQVNFTTGSSTITLTGTWTGTASFEATADAYPLNPSNAQLNALNWVAINGLPLNSTTAASSATANGVWTLNAANITALRVRSSASMTGTIGVLIRASPAASARSGGGGGAGTLTASGPPTAGQFPLFTSATNLSGTTLPLGDLIVGTSSTPIVQVKTGIDVRDTSVAPISTNDFCAALNAAQATAVTNHNYVEAGNPGGFLTGSKVFCNSDPFVGISNPPYIHFGNYTIVISVPWHTVINPFQLFGDVPSLSSGTIIQLCNAVGTPGTCGPSGYPIFPNGGGATNGIMFPLATDGFTPSSYATGTITASGTAVTGSGTAFTPQMVDGFICDAQPCSKTGTWGIIASVTDATHLTLRQATLTASGVAFTIILPNATAAIWDGYQDSNANDGLQASCFGHVFQNLTIDTNSVGGAVGYWNPSCQERTLLMGMKFLLQASTNGGNNNSTPISVATSAVNTTGVYTIASTAACATNGCQGFLFHISGYTGGNIQDNLDAIATASTITSLTFNATTVSNSAAGLATGGTSYGCAAFDRSFIYSGGGSSGSAGPTHFEVLGAPQCGPGVMSTTATTYGWMFEGQIQAFTGAGYAGTLAGIANAQTDMNNGILDLGTIAGKSGNLLKAAVTLDGVRSANPFGIHCEWTTTCIEVGLNNPSTVHIQDIHGANTNTKLVWLHSNTLASVVESVQAGGQASPVLLQDDATSGITITGSTCNTAFNTTCSVPYYAQPNGAASTFAAINAVGNISSTSDGTHAGGLGLFGNTTEPTLPTGSFMLGGPITTVSTPWGINPPAAEPGSACLPHWGAASSHWSAETCSAVVSGDITSLAESKLTGSAAATTITEVGAGDVVTRADVETGNLTAGHVTTNGNSTNNNTNVGEIVGVTGTSTGEIALLIYDVAGTGDIFRAYSGGSTSVGAYTPGTKAFSVSSTGQLCLGACPTPTAGTAGGIVMAGGTVPSGTLTSTATMYANASNFADIMTAGTDLGDAVAEASIIGANVIPKAIGTNPGIAASSISDNGTTIASTETLTIGAAAGSPALVDKSIGFLASAMGAQSSASCTNVTNMTWTIAANKNYILRCEIPMTLAASATIQYCLGGPGTATSYSLIAEGDLGTAGVWSQISTLAQTAYGTKTNASASVAANSVQHVWASIQNGATASGTALTLQTAANGTNNITVGANATCELHQVN